MQDIHDDLMRAYNADGLPEHLSRESKSKVDAASGNAESVLRTDLLRYLRSFRSKELESTRYREIYRQLFPLFEDYAVKVFDAYADELISVLQERDEYVRVLREEITAKLANRIWPRGRDSKFSWRDALCWRGGREPGQYDFALSGLWEKVLADCLNTLLAQEHVATIDFDEWKWRAVYLLRYSDIRDHFPYLLRTRLGHQIPKWEAAFDRHELTSRRSDEGDRTPPGRKPHASEVIGAWLQRHQETKTSLAGKAGISRNTLDRIMRGKRVWPTSRSNVAEAIGCKYDDLLP